MRGKRALVTGGAGFIGANLADRLASDGLDVVLFDSLARPGVERNLAWVEARHPRRIERVIADIRDRGAIEAAAASADVVFHLAGQVAVTTSMDDPYHDFSVNLAGTLNVLEAVRSARRRAPVIFASTNKVYGGLDDVLLRREGGAYVPVDDMVRAHGIGEDRPLDFHTPYGCSKGGADQYVRDYARSFDIPSCVLRMSCVYGPLQMGTEDQGWVAHFLIQALGGRAVSVYGDGRQVRDILHVRDAVDAYVAAWTRIDTVAGRAFNLGGGPANAVSLRDVLAAIGDLTGRPVETRFDAWRPGDQRWYVSDASAARAALGLGQPIGWREGLADLARWLGEAAPAVRHPVSVSA